MRSDINTAKDGKRKAETGFFIMSYLVREGDRHDRIILESLRLRMCEIRDVKVHIRDQPC